TLTSRSRLPRNVPTKLPGLIMTKPLARKSAVRTYATLLVVVLVALVAVGCSTLNTLGAMLSSQVTFTQPQLQHALKKNFPKQYDQLGGLVSLRLTNPTLSIPHNSSRLHLDFEVRLSAAGS